MLFIIALIAAVVAFFVYKNAKLSLFTRMQKRDFKSPRQHSQ